MKFHNDEMLIDVRFSLRVNGLLKPEFITGLIGSQTFNPFIGETFYFFCSLTVFNENPVIVRVNIWNIDIHGYNARLNVTRKTRCEYHNGILLAAVSRAIAGLTVPSVNVP